MAKRKKNYKLKRVSIMLARRKTTTYNNDINYVAAKNEDVLKAIMQSNKKHEKTMKMLAK